jgi:hypothetical protein
MLPTAVHPTNAASTALLTTISVICMLFMIDAESAKAKLIINAFVTRISHGDPAKDESARQTADEHTQKRPTLIQLHSM